MAGFNVSKDLIDQKAAEAVLDLRRAFAKVEAVAAYLASKPHAGGQPDPLETDHGYTDAEAYAIRLVFETLEAVRTANANTFAIARQFTGLEP